MHHALLKEIPGRSLCRSLIARHTMKLRHSARRPAYPQYPHSEPAERAALAAELPIFVDGSGAVIAIRLPALGDLPASGGCARVFKAVFKLHIQMLIYY